MTWRERLSYLVSALIAAGLLFLLFLLLTRRPAAAGAPPTGQAPPDSDAPVVVAVVVPPQEKEKPEEKKPEPAEKEGAPNTATAQKGKNETPTSPMEKQPMPMPMEKQPEKPMEKTGDPVPMEKKPAPPMPMPPAELGNLEGVMPPIKYTGQVAALFQRHPRLEVCWVLDRKAPAGQVRTTHEFLLTRDGRLAYEDARRQRYGEFTEAIGPYDVTQMLKIDDPAQMALYGYREQIRSLAGVSASEASRALYWGNYRKKAELRLLEPVVERFHAAVKSGQVKFDPSRPDRIEVEWGEEGGEPVIRSIVFAPADGPAVPLK